MGVAPEPSVLRNLETEATAAKGTILFEFVKADGTTRCQQEVVFASLGFGGGGAAVPEKLIFDHTVESLLRTLERPIPPEQIKGLDALGIDLSKPLPPAYPLEVYSALIGFIGRQRFPGLPDEQADFEVGRAFIEAYTTQSMLGKALKGVLRVVGRTAPSSG